MSETGGDTKKPEQGTTAPPLAPQHAPQRVTVVAIVVVRRVDIARIQVEVVHIVIIVARRRPPVAVATLIVRRAIVEVARERQRKGIAQQPVNGTIILNVTSRN